MARYIDADLFKQCVQENITRYFTCGTGGYCLAEDVVEDIDAFPTADVVPKSEVEKIFKEVDSMIELVSTMIGLDIIAFGGNYAELKKKYTEASDEKGYGG